MTFTETAPYKDHLSIKVLEQGACPEVVFDTNTSINYSARVEPGSKSNPNAKAENTESVSVRSAPILGYQGTGINPGPAQSTRRKSSVISAS